MAAPQLHDLGASLIQQASRILDFDGAAVRRQDLRQMRTEAQVLADGRLLGEFPVNQVTREMIGAVIWRVKEAGRSHCRAVRSR